jgi:hypothetical protein
MRGQKSNFVKTQNKLIIQIKNESMKNCIKVEMELDIETTCTRPLSK